MLNVLTVKSIPVIYNMVVMSHLHVYVLAN